MTARSARAARHRRIPQRPKPSTYQAPTPGQVDALAYLAQLGAPRPY